jgi:hypothetical protein
MSKRIARQRNLQEKHAYLWTLGSNPYDFFHLMQFFHPDNLSFPADMNDEARNAAKKAAQDFYETLAQLYHDIADELNEQDNPLNEQRYALTSDEIKNSSATRTMQATHGLLTKLIEIADDKTIATPDLKQKKYEEAIKTYRTDCNKIFRWSRYSNTITKICITASLFFLGVVIGTAVGFLAGLPTVIGAVPCAIAGGVSLGTLATAISNKNASLKNDPLENSTKKVLKKADSLYNKNLLTLFSQRDNQTTCTCREKSEQNRDIINQSPQLVA